MWVWLSGVETGINPSPSFSAEYVLGGHLLVSLTLRYRNHHASCFYVQEPLYTRPCHPRSSCSLMAEETSGSAPIAADQAKTIVLKRSHKKSRLGCTSCKLRKVKCDETRPVCRSCRLRRTKCEYEHVTLRKNLSSETPTLPTSSLLVRSDTTKMASISNEPQFCLPSIDSVDMKLLWFYTSATYKSLSYTDDKQSPMDDMLQTVVVQHAFEASFLMDSILELASLHMQSLGQAPESPRALVYRVRSFEGYRKAIEDAHPKTYGALLANSVLRPILSTQFFREPTYKDLYIVDWMLLWRGIPSILRITSASSIANSGMGPLFSRPPLDPEVSLAAIPKQLLLMVSFIDHDDDDASEMQTYQESLRALGSLFETLKTGIDSIMVLRITTWSTIAPPRLLELAQARRPRALVILAHYATFLKLLQDIWWLVGVGDRSIRDICHILEPHGWHKFLDIPLSALRVESAIDLYRVILC